MLFGFGERKRRKKLEKERARAFAAKEEEIKQRMVNGAIGCLDKCNNHAEADEIVAFLLECLGYPEVATAYKKSLDRI